MSNQETHILSLKDIQEIASNAKQLYVSQASPMFVSQKRVEAEYLATVALIESLTTFLNKKALLTTLVKIDY